MGCQVGLTEEAQADLGAVVRFLAEKSPEAAERIGHELLDAALALPLFPRRGSPVRRATPRAHRGRLWPARAGTTKIPATI